MKKVHFFLAAIVAVCLSACVQFKSEAKVDVEVTQDGQPVSGITVYKFIDNGLGEGSTLYKSNAPAFLNPDAATNMTMIARLSTLDARLHVYVADELVGCAEPMVISGDTLFFLTISSSHEGELRFETADGSRLSPLSPFKGESERVFYQADDHYGTPDDPVILIPLDDKRPQKILEDGKLYILLPDGTRYSATGKKVQ